MKNVDEKLRKSFARMAEINKIGRSKDIVLPMPKTAQDIIDEVSY